LANLSFLLRGSDLQPSGSLGVISQTKHTPWRGHTWGIEAISIVGSRHMGISQERSWQVSADPAADERGSEEKVQ
jgi:hypothetical protein